MWTVAYVPFAFNGKPMTNQRYWELCFKGGLAAFIIGTAFVVGILDDIRKELRKNGGAK
jgi:hypothetical protein